MCYKLAAKINDQRDLTRAESETLKYLCEGLSVKLVAHYRNVSSHTVRHQMEEIYSKLSVHNIGALVAMAVALKMVKITIKEINKTGIVCLFLVLSTLSQSGAIGANRVRVRVRIPRPTVSRTTRLGSRLKKDFA